MRIIIFDTETTGYIKSPELPDSQQPKIIELYAVAVNSSSWEISDRLHVMVDPGEALDEEIIRVTGIKDADVKGKGKFPVHLDQIARFFLGSAVVIGHNVTFDCDMLRVELQRMGRVDRFPWPPNRICTVEQTEFIEGRRLNLSDLHNALFGQGFDDAHRAESDVMATYRCAKKLAEDRNLILPDNW